MPVWLPCFPDRLKPIGLTVQDIEMIRLTKALKAWGTPAFEGALKQEIEQLEASQLPRSRA